MSYFFVTIELFYGSALVMVCTNSEDDAKAQAVRIAETEIPREYRKIDPFCQIISRPAPEGAKVEAIILHSFME